MRAPAFGERVIFHDAERPGKVPAVVLSVDEQGRATLAVSHGYGRAFSIHTNVPPRHGDRGRNQSFYEVETFDPPPASPPRID